MRGVDNMINNSYQYNLIHSKFICYYMYKIFYEKFKAAPKNQ